MDRILLADDHPLTMVGMIATATTCFPDAKIDTATDFYKTIDLLEKQQYRLVVLDINMPGGNRTAMIESIRLRSPNIIILLCSSYDEQLYALPYLRAGANGFISKTAGLRDFQTAFSTVLSGKLYTSLSVFQNAVNISSTRGDSKDSFFDLTSKEVDIAQLLSNGLSTSQISEQMNLSASSISIYKSKIYAKLNVKNNVELKTYLALIGA